MKKIILLMIPFIVFLLTGIVNAGTTYFPPAASWVQGYTVGTASYTSSDSALSITVTFTGSAGYYASVNTVDLRNVSYIKVDWYGIWGFGASVGLMRIGVSTSKTNVLFTGGSQLNKTTGFSRINNTLNVSDPVYKTDYYLKFGINFTNSLGGSMYLFVYNITLYNYTKSYPMNASEILTTSATLNGLLQEDSNIATTCGFWYGKTSPVTELNADGNVTATGTYTKGQSFSKGISGLTTGQYYYVRTWARNKDVTYLVGHFNISTNESYFLALPDVPTGITPSLNSTSSINLTWTNASVPAGNKHAVYIRYSKTSTPNSLTSGTFGANESLRNNVTIAGLDQDTTYYFSLWTFTSDTGSPYIEAYSGSYTSTSYDTTGSDYNISIRYENGTSTGADLQLNGSNCQLLIYYTDGGTEYIKFHNDTPVAGVWKTMGEQSKPSLLFIDNNITGNFSIRTSKKVLYFEFRWNETLINRTTRKIVPTTGQTNISFYIRIDLHVYQGIYGQELTNSIVTYNYAFLDTTNLFQYPNNPLATIYTYDANYNKIIIHSEYFDSEDRIHPWLIYQESYFIGVKCDVMEIERLQAAPTDGTIDHNEIAINDAPNIIYNFYDLIILDISRDADGFYINYQDTTSSTDNAKFKMYYFYNQTNIPEAYNETNGTNSYPYRFDASHGYIENETYYWIINATLNDDVSVYYHGVYNATGITFGNFTNIWTQTDLDNIFTIIFGASPFYSDGSYGVPDNVFVPWTYLLIFGACFIILTTLGKMNAFLGGVGVGLTLLFSGIIILGIQSALFSNYSWWQGATLSLVGVFVLAISIIGLLGGVER